MPLARSLVGAWLAASSSAALAQVVVTDAWVRGMVPAQTATGAFMQLRSVADVALVSAGSPVADAVELHQMHMDGSVMRMSAVKRLDLAANKVVKLEPGGYHVMLMGIREPLREGDRVPVTLTFEDKAGKRFVVEVDAPVRALTTSAPAAHKH